MKFEIPALIGLLMFAVPSAMAQAPSPTDIGNLGGGQAGVNAVANEFIAGTSTTGSGDGHGYLWSAATGTMEDLGVLPGTSFSKALSVNSNGEVVGLSYGFNADFTVYTSYAFYWSVATGMININSISNAGYYGAQVFINDAGVVVGVDIGGNVYRWTLSGGIEDLGPACTADSVVAGINARGDIVGNSGFDGSGYFCSFFAPGSSNTLTIVTSPGLATPPPQSESNCGAVDIQANAINDSGVVVGTYFDYCYLYSGYDVALGGFYNAVVHNSHAFKWTLGEGFTDLGNLGVSGTLRDPTFGSSALAINSLGTIVGYSYLPTGGYGAFVYDPIGGSLTRLPGLASGETWVLAGGINDDGVVVGYSGSNLDSVMWIDGVPTKLTPSFAPVFPGSPLIKGGTIAGNGLDRNWNGHAWTLALSPPPPPPVDCVVASQGFSACSASCGGGTQTEILAIVTPAANGGAACRSPITQACNTQACVTYAFDTGAFGSCQPTNGVCGAGIRSRTVSCLGSDGNLYPLSSCSGTAPATSQSCSTQCTPAQLLELACPPTGSYKNHGAYVSCVSNNADALKKQGLITGKESGAFVSAAGESSIGK